MAEALAKAEAPGKHQEDLDVARFPLLKALDKNSNGRWDADEAGEIQTAAAHLSIAVDLGKAEPGKGEARPAVRVKKSLLHDSLRNLQGADPVRVLREPDKLVVSLAGARLELRVDPDAGSLDPKESAKQILELYDGDANGYLENREFDNGESRAFFVLLDENGDGKAFLAEIEGYYERSSLPTMSQFHLRSVSLGAGLFRAIDASRDGCLGQRELREAAERIAAFDKNGDGQVAFSEIPDTISFTFGRGTSRTELPIGPETVVDEPAWFRNMDRNSDGDISPREFLGDPGLFRKLDTDGDGLISRDEGHAATPIAKEKPSTTAESVAGDKN
jgi:Ca2+-binding EF-hand superfamily protein